MSNYREKGFQELQDYKIIRNCNPTIDGHYCKDWISIKEKEYLIKCGTFEDCYNEVFWSYVMNYLPIQNVKYDLIKYEGLYGVMTENYNYEKYPTTSLKDILTEYFRNTMEENVLIDDLWNIEDVTDAYSFKYQKKYEETVIEELRQNTIRRFIIQILLGDKDLNSKNMEVYVKESPMMAPLYDFGKYGKLSLTHKGYRLAYKRITDLKNYISPLHTFLSHATKKELEILKETIEWIKMVPLKRVIEEMEDHIHYKIPCLLKYNLATKLYRNVNKISKKRSLNIN